MSYPIITLNNGITIANFSTPHEFKFATGEVLPACDEMRAKRLTGVQLMDELEYESNDGKRWIDISTKFKMTPAIKQALDETTVNWANRKFHIMLVPPTLMENIKLDPLSGYIRFCRTAHICSHEHGSYPSTISPDRFYA